MNKLKKVTFNTGPENVELCNRAENYINELLERYKHMEINDLWELLVYNAKQLAKK